jgi:DNA-binding FrmR family transcriptional regulator
MAKTTQGSAAPAAKAPEMTGCSTKEMMTPELRADLLLRLRKAAGQVNGVAKMVEGDRYCMDVLQQLDAAQKALEQVSKKVMRNYLERCVTDAMSGGDPLIYDELMRVIYRAR